MFPAGAGVILNQLYGYVQKIRVPRRCGGDPISKQSKSASDCVFPAGAGVILVGKPRPPYRSCVPRRCGGDPKNALVARARRECSPQVRG